MPQSRSVVLVATMGTALILTKKEGGKLWTLPLIHNWNGSDQNLTQLAYTYFYPLFEELTLRNFRLLIEPEEKIHLDDECVHCAVFSVDVKGAFSKDAEGKYWLASREVLVPQVLNEEVRALLGLPQVQGCLS